MTTYDDVATLVAGEAAAAKQALPGVGDAAVEVALGHAARLVRERRAELLAANAEDVAAAEGRLDAGSLDRLRLDDARVENIAVSLAETASLPPLDRDVRSWRLDNGLADLRAARARRDDRRELRGAAERRRSTSPRRC